MSFHDSYAFHAITLRCSFLVSEVVHVSAFGIVLFQSRNSDHHDKPVIVCQDFSFPCVHFAAEFCVSYEETVLDRVLFFESARRVLRKPKPL